MGWAGAEQVYGAYPDKASVLLSSADKGFVVKGATILLLFHPRGRGCSSSFWWRRRPSAGAPALYDPTTPRQPGPVAVRMSDVAHGCPLASPTLNRPTTFRFGAGIKGKIADGWWYVCVLIGIWALHMPAHCDSARLQVRLALRHHPNRCALLAPFDRGPHHRPG
jgi:hypothetical protein